MIQRPPRSTRTDTLFPYTTLFRSDRVPFCSTPIVLTVTALPKVHRAGTSWALRLPPGYHPACLSVGDAGSEQRAHLVPETLLTMPVGRIDVGQGVHEDDEARRVELQPVAVGPPATLAVDDVRDDAMDLIAVLSLGELVSEAFRQEIGRAHV